jgi:hypothetical protein
MTLVADIVDRQNERMHTSERCRVCGRMKQIDACLANGTRQVDERPAKIGRGEAMNRPVLDAPRQRPLMACTEQNYAALRRDPGEGVKEPTRISSNAARRSIQAAAVESDSHGCANVQKESACL